MYTPKAYQLTRDEAIAVMKAYPFAQLVTNVNGRPIATHIPIEITVDGERVIATGHLAYGNPQKRTLTTGEALLIFNGPHAYISSSWYDHHNVSTWNYVAVHAYGKAALMRDEELAVLLQPLVNRYEAMRPHGRTWEALNPDMVRDEMRGIVGFTIELTDIQGAAKLSNNRHDGDFQTIVTELERAGERDLAEWMKRARPQLF